ncbi:hypothetical protein K1T71_013747 [Dendrolimus kikuchii]|uniref:Uncharacterized protein n=1 Tax=Dendrolimus kikuchii TaxID=765133 RepID=A0ACC1CHA4_9NEOP|nr:hypothetical protein K1T71_013747 [Dendrolimus kikuchii]
MYARLVEERLAKADFSDLDVDNDWDSMKESIVESAKEACGCAKRHITTKGDEWWDADVKSSVERKRKAWLDYVASLQQNDSMKEMKKEIYRLCKNETKALVKEKLSAFLDHLNSISSNIKFTMELEANNKLAFLDVLILRNPDNTLGHTVYRKPTHTDKYLNGSSHHHPSQLATVGKSLFQRARKICDENHIAGELQHVKRVLQRNQLKTPHQRHKGPKPPSVERCPATLPYIKGVTDRIVPDRCQLETCPKDWQR